MPDPADARAWKRDVRFLQEQHDLLVAAIRAFPAPRLGRKLGAAGTARGLVLGIAAHDTHHGGQIQLLKRLAADAGTAR